MLLSWGDGAMVLSMVTMVAKGRLVGADDGNAGVAMAAHDNGDGRYVRRRLGSDGCGVGCWKKMGDADEAGARRW